MINEPGTNYDTSEVTAGITDVRIETSGTRLNLPSASVIVNRLLLDRLLLSKRPASSTKLDVIKLVLRGLGLFMQILLVSESPVYTCGLFLSPSCCGR